MGATDDSWCDLDTDGSTTYPGAASVEQRPLAYRSVQGSKTTRGIRGKGGWGVSHQDGVWKFKPQGDSIMLFSDEQCKAIFSDLSSV